MKRRLLTFSFLFAVLAASAWVSYYVGGVLHVRSVLAASRVPFTIIYQDFTYLPKGQGDLDYDHPNSTQSYLKARKGDGSIGEITFATYDHSSRANTVAVRKLHSMTDRALIVAYPQSGVKSTFPLTDSELAAIKAIPEDGTCVTDKAQMGKRQFLGTANFNGLAVVKHLINTETTVTEAWSAPELDCELVYLKTIFLGAGQRPTDATVKSAVKITKGEPEAWIFDTSASSEMPPSVAIRTELENSRRAAGVTVPLHHETEEARRKLAACSSAAVRSPSCRGTATR